MYLAPMRGFFYACMRVTGRWVSGDWSRIHGLQPLSLAMNASIYGCIARNGGFL